MTLLWFIAFSHFSIGNGLLTVCGVVANALRVCCVKCRYFSGDVTNWLDHAKENYGGQYSETQVESTKLLVRLFPFIAFQILYRICVVQVRVWLLVVLNPFFELQSQRRQIYNIMHTLQDAATKNGNAIFQGLTSVWVTWPTWDRNPRKTFFQAWHPKTCVLRCHTRLQPGKGIFFSGVISWHGIVMPPMAAMLLWENTRFPCFSRAIEGHNGHYRSLYHKILSYFNAMSDSI